MNLEGSVNAGKEIRIDTSSNDYENHVDRVSNMNLIRDIADLQSRIEAVKNLSVNESNGTVTQANEKDIERLEDAMLSLYDQLKTNITLSRDGGKLEGRFASEN